MNRVNYGLPKRPAVTHAHAAPIGWLIALPRTGGPPGTVTEQRDQGGHLDGTDDQGVDEHADRDRDADLGDGDGGQLGQGVGTSAAEALEQIRGHLAHFAGWRS